MIEDYTPTTAKGLRQEADALEDQADRLMTQAQAYRVRAARIDDGPVVLVRFPGPRASGRYAYKVPEGLTVNPGDLVVVGSAYGTAKVVEVTGYGRGGYDGPLKTLVGKVQVLKVDDDAS
jgi:hypothetical protein